MGSVLIAVITGAIIGWLGSVVMRTDSRAGILGDIGLGSFCGLATVALSQDFLLDAFLTAALAAMLVIGTLAILRRSEERRSRF